ncbi:Gfo/Idh/MocA family protein [Streptomyces sp. NPDC060194]|uniref:Gfo/Idh/MocA family protein n=1 Tax=Streptomyces sp. NPDC060194 TaxID=3347069 RepID=UPI00365E3938
MTSPAAGRNVRIGLLGTGPWASAVHGPALAAHPGVTLTGVWGRRPEAAAELAGTLGTRPYADADALFADSDAVAVALPPDVQAELAGRAADAGCHLLLDKPLATTTAAAQDAAARAEAAGVASVVFFTLRFAAGSAAWIDEQAARGGWFTARAQWLAPLYAPGSDSPYAASPWRRERGGLWDVGPHALSVLLPVLGDVTTVTAARGPADLTHLVLRHTSGASSTAVLSLHAPTAAAGSTVELLGADGAFSLPEKQGESAEAAYSRAVDALLAAIATGEPHPCDIHFAARVTQILAAAETSLG